MTELKTLKDLAMRNGEEYWKAISINELKAEAIKWVNDCECMGRGCAGCVKLMLFFNLGAEDLK